jgi:hypothetical protein
LPRWLLRHNHIEHIIDCANIGRPVSCLFV